MSLSLHLLQFGSLMSLKVHLLNAWSPLGINSLWDCWEVDIYELRHSFKEGRSLCCILKGNMQTTTSFLSLFSFCFVWVESLCLRFVPLCWAAEGFKALSQPYFEIFWEVPHFRYFKREKEGNNTVSKSVVSSWLSLIVHHDFQFLLLWVFFCNFTYYWLPFWNKMHWFVN